MTPSKKIAIIITAAGSSSRMGGGTKKEFLPLGDGTVLSTCVKTFVEASKNPENSFDISHLVVTVPKDGSLGAAAALSAFFNFDDSIKEKVEYVSGGTSRQRSVFNALSYLKRHGNPPDLVLIHDGARPFLTAKIIYDVIDAALDYGAAVPGITPTDTIKEMDSQGFIERHLQRASLLSVQTPQAFNFEKIYNAHISAFTDPYEYTDDSEIYGKYCGKVKMVLGDVKNKKITYPGDI